MVMMMVMMIVMMMLIVMMVMMMTNNDDDDSDFDEKKGWVVSDHQMCCELSGFPESPDWLFDSVGIRYF